MHELRSSKFYIAYMLVVGRWMIDFFKSGISIMCYDGHSDYQKRITTSKMNNWQTVHGFHSQTNSALLTVKKQIKAMMQQHCCQIQSYVLAYHLQMHGYNFRENRLLDIQRSSAAAHAVGEPRHIVTPYSNRVFTGFRWATSCSDSWSGMEYWFDQTQHLSEWIDLADIVDVRHLERTGCLRPLCREQLLEANRDESLEQQDDVMFHGDIELYGAIGEERGFLQHHPIPPTTGMAISYVSRRHVSMICREEHDRLSAEKRWKEEAIRAIRNQDTSSSSQRPHRSNRPQSWWQPEQTQHNHTTWSSRGWQEHSSGYASQDRNSQ